MWSNLLRQKLGLGPGEEQTLAATFRTGPVQVVSSELASASCVDAFVVGGGRYRRHQECLRDLCAGVSDATLRLTEPRQLLEDRSSFEARALISVVEL